MTLIIFILILVVLILVHEFGHFIIAKAFGIRVDEFGIFFPPKLYGKKFGETEYTLNALPFGGFVKIYGENIDEANPDLLVNPRSFVHKPRLIQAAVIVAGIVFNIIFAWLVLSAGYMIGMQSAVEHVGVGQVQNAKVTIMNVLPGSPADKAGVKPNDILSSIQTGKDTLPQNQNTKAVQAFIAAHQDESMVLTVTREGAPVNLLAKPADGFVTGHKALGVELEDVGILKLNPFLALVQGAIVTKQMTVVTAQGLGSFFYTIVHGTANFGSVAGPIGIVKIGSAAVSHGIANTLFLTALISINLAVINLVPVPGLDGGRFLFIIIEAIRRKPISEKLATRMTIAGFALLITLMLVISYHDILRLIHTS